MQHMAAHFALILFGRKCEYGTGCAVVIMQIPMLVADKQRFRTVLYTGSHFADNCFDLSAGYCRPFSMIDGLPLVEARTKGVKHTADSIRFGLCILQSIAFETAEIRNVQVCG